MRELYVSIDVESDGPIPGPHSMWSLGSTAILDTGKIVGEFEENLQELEGAKGDPDTLAWWDKQDPLIRQACRMNSQPPELVMARFVRWVEELAEEHQARPTCVAYPAGYDWTYVYWYMIRFGQKSPFSFSCLDVKSYVAGKLGMPFRDVSKRTMPKRWFKDLPKHTHRAGDDAKEQGLLFLNILRDKNASSNA